MRALLLYAFLLLLCINSKAQTANSYHSSNKIASSKDNIDQEWLTRAQHHIMECGYYFKPETNNKKFYSSNAAQRLGFRINNSGYVVSPIRNTDKFIPSEQWEERLTFSRIMRSNHALNPEGGYSISQEKSRLQYNYPGFSIQYLNDPHGLRQNFIITEKLSGSTNLELLLNIEGSLSGSINNNELLFKDENGITRLYYRDLKAWDADHHPLSATMLIREKNKLAIIVNDQEAHYPITIDPLNQTPEWTTSADGILPTLFGAHAVEAAYGFSVAGLGDVNGDGYSDVAVGAPSVVDIISGTGTLSSVGAVFVYFGSATGLPVTPTKVLQPSTAIAGALFGYSIAGGDVNNDGRSDIMVGAPMDNTTISIGGGGTATGTVGKVYVFNGATLTTTTTPLFMLQLSGNGILENGVNLAVNALFGFSVAVTEDLNADGKRDMIVGAPNYAGIITPLGIHTQDAQSGGAFVFLTNAANTNTTIQKLEPIKSSLLNAAIPESNINGLLFGYAVDGLGDYNNDGRPDVVATAPAGIDAGTLSGLLTGKLLQGSANIYYGTGAGVNTSAGALLTATSSGLLINLIGPISNLANLFGESVRGVRNANGARNGNVLVGAPLGNDIINVLNLQLKTGTVSVFKKQAASPPPPPGFVIPDQVLTSPRNSNIILQTIQSNLLFGYSLDNVFDINCDGIGDIIVGEPASSGAQLLNANVAGGAAYVYLGLANGTYQTAPVWTLTAFEDAFLGVNATSLIGYSVAGAGRIKGSTRRNRILVGSPSRTLDFGNGLLHLGSTFGTLFSLVSGDNGVGKAFAFDTKLCNGVPIAVNDVNSTNEDTPVNGNSSSNDTPSEDGGNVWSLVGVNGGASHGTVTMNPDGTYTYTPNANYNGTDVFNYKVCDVDNDCSSATVTITIIAVDDQPVAVNDVNSTNEDTPVSGNSSTNDTPSGDGGNVWSLVGTNGGASHGTVTMNPNGTYTYTPNANYNGTDVFHYKVCDADNDCSSAIVTITINPVDDQPVAVNDVNSTNEDTPVNGNAATNDTPSGDGGNVWTLIGANGGAAHGTVTMNPNGTYTYTPAPNFHGTDVFNYRLCDADNDCSTATVTITVNSVDDHPVAVHDVNSTNEDTPVSGNASTNDTPSGDGGNTWVLVGPNGGASHGTVTMNPDGTYTYTPAPNFHGTDVFTYKVCDADNDCSTTTVTITVNSADDQPVAVNDVNSTNEDTPVSGNASTNDTPSGDGGNVWSLIGANGGASHGTVTMNPNGSYTYTPAPNFHGTDVFNYKLCDADNDCSTATVTITVNSVDDQPVAVNDVNSTSKNTPVNGNASTNDTPSGDGGNTWALVGANGGASHGTVTMNPDGSYTYTPAANFIGTDTFTYSLCDADNDCSTATVTITVNDATCNNNTIVVDQNVTVNFAGATPTYSGDPDLQPFFSYDKTGPNPEGWRAIFNMGAYKLLVKNGATITTTRVNGAAPGIEIIGTCTMEVEFGGHIIVSASNKNAGNIDVQMDGSILINGEVKDEATGTLGLPGHITIVSKDDNITEGPTGLIQILGIDPGGNTITLQTCKSSLANNGDITISGLVKSFAHAHSGDQTLNRPNINVVSLNGSVTINANTAEPLYDEQSINGGLYDIYGGLLSWVRDNVIPGQVKVQAKNNIIVNGHGTDPIGSVRTSFGAIAAVSTASSSPGGLVDVRSLEGSITGNDRAFDVSGRNLLATNYAVIRLHAKFNISLNRLGANNNFNPVVNASSPTSGSHGGRNELRSFSGSILIGPNAIVSANVPAGSGTIQGTNLLTSCTGVTQQGTVIPADQNAADNSGVCNPAAPTGLFVDCPDALQTRMITDTRVVPEESVNTMLAYPNPARGKVTLRLSSNAESRYLVELVDISGRTFGIGNINATVGMNYYSFDLSNMAGGVYMIIVRNDVTKLTTKIAVE